MLSCSCSSCLTFGHSLSLPFLPFLALSFFGRSLRGFWLALVRLRSSCYLCELFRSASLVLFLFLPVRVLSLSLHALLLALSQTALDFLVGVVIAEASFPAVRSLPSAPSSCSYAISSYSSSSSPHSSLRVTGVAGVTAYAVFSAMLPWLHPCGCFFVFSFSPFFLLPFRCSFLFAKSFCCLSASSAEFCGLGFPAVIFRLIYLVF